jgi:hypothetical protein
MSLNMASEVISYPDAPNHAASILGLGFCLLILTALLRRRPRVLVRASRMQTAAGSTISPSVEPEDDPFDVHAVVFGISLLTRERVVTAGELPRPHPVAHPRHAARAWRPALALRYVR